MTIYSPSHYICFKLSRAMRKVQRYYETNLAALGITSVQFYVMSSLWEADGVKFKELAKKLSMDGATLTGIIDRLENLGYVSRQDDPEDGRSVLICLANKAKDNRVEFGRLAGTLDAELRKMFSEEEFAALGKMLDRIGEEYD